MNIKLVKLTKEINDIPGYNIWVSPYSSNRLVCENSDLQIGINWASNTSSLEILMFDVHINIEFGYNPSRCFDFQSLAKLTGDTKDKIEKANIKNFIALTTQCPQKYIRNKKLIERMFELSSLSYEVSK